MNHVIEYGLLEVPALRVEVAARKVAAGCGDEKCSTVHLLAALARTGGPAGDLVRWCLGPATEEIDDHIDARKRARVRTRLSSVGYSDELIEVYASANRYAHSVDRVAVSISDLLRAIAVIPGGHTPYVNARKIDIVRQLDRLERGEAVEMPNRSPSSPITDFVASLIHYTGVGAELVLFGAGVLLHRGFAHTIAMMGGRGCHFEAFWRAPEGILESAKSMSRGRFGSVAFGTRAALFLLSAAIFSVIIVERVGLDIPLLPTDVSMDDGLVVTFTQLVFSSRHSWEVWCAVGAGFLAFPAVDDLWRAYQWRRIDRPLLVMDVLGWSLAVVARMIAVLDHLGVWFYMSTVFVGGLVAVGLSVAVGYLIALSVL